MITTNKPINELMLQIVKDGFEEQKGISVLRVYSYDDNIYGIYVNDIHESLSFSQVPLMNMSTDIDGHNIFMMELGLLLRLIYSNGSVQMFNILHEVGDVSLPNILNDNFTKLFDLSCNNPPLQLSSFQLIKWIDDFNDGNLNISLDDLMDMVEHFMVIEPLDIDISDRSSEVVMKNTLNMVKQELKSRRFKKVTEATISKIDKLFVELQLDLYMTDEK